MTRAQCSVEGCEDLLGWNGMCPKHATRVKRHGNPHTVIQPSQRATPRGAESARWVGDAASYSGVHLRMRATKGHASQYPCFDCGATAAQWSYDKADPLERLGDGHPYSLDPDHYVPRCIPCHRKFDGPFGAARGRPINCELVERLLGEGVGPYRIADQLHVSPERIRRLIAELGLVRPPRVRRSGRTGTPKTHGYSGYCNYACRCDVCSEASRSYKRAQRQRREQDSVGQSYAGQREPGW